MRASWVFVLAVMLALFGYGRDSFDDWIAATRLPVLTVQTGTEVRGKNAELLRAYTVAGGRWRLDVALSDVDPDFINGLIAFEDSRFNTHAGVDLLALVRAGGQALWNGRVVSGASTLTMQVARLLEGSGTGKVAGKGRQIRLALALERQLSKAEILRLYLNIAPYGGNLEGIRAASLTYFGKEPRRMTPAEIALLIALPQSPEARRPDRAPDVAARARARVLARLARDGLISAAEAEAALREAPPRARRPFPALAAHLSDSMRAQQSGAQRIDLTIDATLQRSLETLAAEAVASIGAQVQTAILVADHQSGEILASVGSSAYRADARAGFIDMTQALRSPGSTLKPLIYGLAFDEGLGHPETLIDDRPTDFNGYRPQNFDKHFRGMVRMRSALQQSLNIPVVALTEALRPEKLLSALTRAGTKYQLPTGQAGLAIALGGIGLSLQDLVQLYGGIARGGIALPLTAHSKGNAGGTGLRILSRANAWQVGDILAGLPPPAGAPANRLAYKTGTSYGNRDAWAIGYDGAHVIGVWIGRPDGTPMPGALGADLAAPVLFASFARLKPVLIPQPPAPPETLLVAGNDLPLPLRQFRGRNAAFDAKLDAPKLVFPPDGSEVELLNQSVLLKIEGGTAPYTILANNVPLHVGVPAREMTITSLTAGFVTFSVIDSQGRSSRSHIRLRDP